MGVKLRGERNRDRVWAGKGIGVTLKKQKFGGDVTVEGLASDFGELKASKIEQKLEVEVWFKSIDGMGPIGRANSGAVWGRFIPSLLVEMTDCWVHKK